MGLVSAATRSLKLEKDGFKNETSAGCLNALHNFVLK